MRPDYAEFIATKQFADVQSGFDLSEGERFQVTDMFAEAEA